MAAPKRLTPADSTAAVGAFLEALVHPHKALVESIRREILGAHQSIQEGMKWNAPSFRTTEYFATINLREKNGVGVILHLGAKARDVDLGQDAIANPADPERLLQWLAKDRAMVVFADVKDFAAKKLAFKRVVTDWIHYVE